MPIVTYGYARDVLFDLPRPIVIELAKDPVITLNPDITIEKVVILELEIE